MKNKIVEKIKWNAGGTTWLVRLLGFTVVFGWAGNCITRCLHVQTDKCNLLHLTYRTAGHNEVQVYVRRSGRISWNSSWIAKHWGVCKDEEVGYWQYNGWLGTHTWV